MKAELGHSLTEPDFGVYAIQHMIPKDGPQGSFSYDLNSISFNLQWLSYHDFEVEAWLESESKKLTIDFTIHETVQAGH